MLTLFPSAALLSSTFFDFQCVVICFVRSIPCLLIFVHLIALSFIQVNPMIIIPIISIFSPICLDLCFVCYFYYLMCLFAYKSIRVSLIRCMCIVVHRLLFDLFCIKTLSILINESQLHTAYTSMTIIWAEWLNGFESIETIGFVNGYVRC